MQGSVGEKKICMEPVLGKPLTLAVTQSTGSAQGDKILCEQVFTGHVQIVAL